MPQFCSFKKNSDISRNLTRIYNTLTYTGLPTFDSHGEPEFLYEKVLYESHALSLSLYIYIFSV